MLSGRLIRASGFVIAAAGFVAAAVSLGSPGAVATPVETPVGHETSTGVAVAGRGFITLTAVWVTPGLTGQPYYEQWIPSPEDRELHRRAASSYTVMLLEVDNRSPLNVEGYLSVNVRLLVDGERRRPVADEAFARGYPALVPEQRLEQVGPGKTLLRVYAFPKVAEARDVALVIRPLWLMQGRRQIGLLPQFELAFRPQRLAFPP